MKARHRVLSRRGIKTMQSISGRSIPSAQRSSYLDLYILMERKRRLEKELASQEVKRVIAKKQLQGIDKKIVKLQALQSEEFEAGKVKKSQKRGPTSIKTMSIHYG